MGATVSRPTKAMVLVKVFMGADCTSFVREVGSYCEADDDVGPGKQVGKPTKLGLSFQRNVHSSPAAAHSFSVA